MLGQSCHWDMCLWVCVSGLSLRLPAENAYFALKAYANIWQSGLNLSDCTLDPREKLIRRENKDERTGRGREREAERYHSLCVCHLYRDVPTTPKKNHYVTFKPFPTVLQSEKWRQQATTPTERQRTPMEQQLEPEVYSSLQRWSCHWGLNTAGNLIDL